MLKYRFYLLVCNLKCSHCYQTEDRPAEMSLTEIASLIDEVSGMLNDWRDTYEIGLSSSFTVTGGELRQMLTVVCLQMMQGICLCVLPVTGRRQLPCRRPTVFSVKLTQRKEG
jgi:hypothetical protein